MRYDGHGSSPRIPKLLVRSKIDNEDVSPVLPLPYEGTMQEFDITKRPVSNRTTTSNLSSACSTQAPASRRTTMTSAPPKKKKASMMGFLSLKEPSMSALDNFAEAQRQQTQAKGHGDFIAGGGFAKSSKSLPQFVPKTNERWDGMPQCISKSKKASSVRHFHGARSIMSGASSIRSWDASSSDAGSMLRVPIRSTAPSSPSAVSFRGTATGAANVVPPGWDVISRESIEFEHHPSKAIEQKPTSLYSLPLSSSQARSDERSPAPNNVPFDARSFATISSESPTTPLNGELVDGRPFNFSRPMTSGHTSNCKDIAPWESLSGSLEDTAGSDDVIVLGEDPPLPGFTEDMPLRSRPKHQDFVTSHSLLHSIKRTDLDRPSPKPVQSMPLMAAGGRPKPVRMAPTSHPDDLCDLHDLSVVQKTQSQGFPPTPLAGSTANNTDPPSARPETSHVVQHTVTRTNKFRLNPIKSLRNRGDNASPQASGLNKKPSRLAMFRK